MVVDLNKPLSAQPALGVLWDKNTIRLLDFNEKHSPIIWASCSQK